MVKYEARCLKCGATIAVEGNTYWHNIPGPWTVCPLCGGLVLGGSITTAAAVTYYAGDTAECYGVVPRKTEDAPDG